MAETVQCQHCHRMATPVSNASYDDEERQVLLECEPRCESRCESPSRWRPPKKYLRLFRPTKATAYLVLIDLVIIGLLVCAFEPLITLLRRNEELFTPRVTLSHPTQSSSSSPSWWPHADQRKIPRILHQTCANATIPAKWVASQRSCLDAYSDYEYKLWTDELARDLIAAEYPWFLDSWDNYAFPIQRADAIRYFVLYHYGGIYFDMDTLCSNESFPVEQFESADSPHHALYKSTLPTGVTNDFMVSSARHPVYASTISKLPTFYMITRFWARLLPYVNIMLSSGPLFLTLVVKDYLLEQPSLPTPAIQVVNATELAPYFTDLESSTWHRADAHALMWLGVRPWTWYTLGAVGFVIGICIVNYMMLSAFNAIRRRIPSVAYVRKLAKVS